MQKTAPTDYSRAQIILLWAVAVLVGPAVVGMGGPAGVAARGV